LREDTGIENSVKRATKAVAVSVVAVVLVLIVLINSSLPGKGSNSAVFGSTLSSASNIIDTSSRFTTSLAPPSVTVWYNVSFAQQGYFCPPDTSGYGAFWAPWAVTLVDNASSYNVTETQPPGLPFPHMGTLLGSRANANYSVITFLVRAGTYNYTIYPDDYLTVNGSDTGYVAISGQNVSLPVMPYTDGAGCGSLITTISTASSTTSNASQP
jgi:hypothetical protein